ncbi:ethylbenzene dehydrogenase-related protein [Chthonobacter albigriseus]|uniref:ethylbenzene dehydrogenase-related protein n=1 Tax=Chthonobacter albigriseus TaxID=1683161 RepID=UPI001FCEA600|nr:ethylbenzene dehydrogenase-related protein [Chthonobacter albigriseus]
MPETRVEVMRTASGGLTRQREKTAEKVRPDVAPSSPPPRSDVGTIVLHWTLTISILVSLATGLRLSADAEGSWFAKALDPILPQGEIWTPHFIAAFLVVGCIAAYTVYMRLGQLQRRVSLRKTVVFTLPTAPKLRWGAVNVLLYWVLFAAVLVLTVTGILLYLGWGGGVVTVHYSAALVVLGYIGVHIFSHTMMGGIRQLLRLVRPQPLRIRRGAMAKPFAAAAAVGAAVMAGFYMGDSLTHPVLTIGTTSTPPQIDGDLSDGVWSEASVATVHTMQGSNLGGTGESTVEIRAVRDAANVYFAFRWNDPTRSLKRLPLIKREDGWHLLNNAADTADETAYYEDKFAVTFSRSNTYGSGGSTHMGPKPLGDKPGALNKRGLHYTTDGSYMDMWQWKASRGGMLGMLDDMWFGPPLEPKEAQVNGTARYSAGYDGDAGKKFYVYNYGNEPPGGYRGPVKVERLPKDWRATTAKLGALDLSVEVSDDPNGQWWMFEDESVPYDPAVDAAIPVGTVIPGVLIQGTYEGSRADVKGAAHWSDGYWTLETVRPLVTGDDVKDLPIESGIYLWVAVFDHNQTRHTRHVRPVEIQLR